MAPVLLDTTVLIDVLRGRPGPTDRLRRLRTAGDTPYVCAVNVEEVTRGLHPGEETAAAVFLQGLRVVPLAASEGRVAGAWRRSFAQKGRTLSQADCLVAAAAAAIGARLATGNPKDFPMTEVTVEPWPVDE
jgi:predicted nucleic acid-binding protein